MQRFNLKLGRLKFSAELKYRITVIDDESGKGKTCLFDAVKKFPGNRAVLTSSLKLQAVDSLNDIENNNEKKIILIDEDCNCLQKNNIKETIKYISNSDDWFVLMTRENKLAQLAYSVDAIYKIVKKSTELTISPKYQKLYTKNSKYPSAAAFPRSPSRLCPPRITRNCRKSSPTKASACRRTNSKP